MTESSSPASYGFGIIGVGMIADFHARAIGQVTGAKLVGVATRSAESGRAFAEKHGLSFSTTSVSELLARKDVHVVCVTTPSGAHLDPVLAAIHAGKQVIVEKPMEITTERADAIIDAARLAGVRVAPIFQARFGTGAQAVKQALDQGRFGRLVLASAAVKWHRTAAYYSGWKGTLALDGGGALINQAIHAVDLLQWFAGMPSEVFCFKTRRVHTGIEAEDTASATLRFASGALGTIEATTALYPGWQRRLEICGENGSVMLEDDQITRWDFREPHPEDDAIRTAKDSVSLGSGASAPNAINFAGHQRQIQDLVDALREGRPAALDAKEGRKAVALIRALYTSAETGQLVKLD